MIVAENNKPSLEEFRLLMQKTDELLNSEAVGKYDYYSKRNSSLLENDVFDALCRCAENTPFEKTIELVSGAAFPDIVASKYYGIEVKSTNKNHWKSIGSSILESTRNQNVERIFLTFGKLSDPITFMSRPYEECLSGISVTHYPRYQIDMELQPGETIFDKMGISYEEIRKMDNPVSTVSKYYKSKLKPGESLWWATNDSEESATPPILKLWTALTSGQKNTYTVHGYALFPEIVGNSSVKYQRYALWLAKNCSIINTNIRDQFSAGGKVTVKTANGTFERMPAAFDKIAKNHEMIKEIILNTDEATLTDCWQTNNISDDRIEQWCKLISGYTRNPLETYKMLCCIFV